jgi:hypothetical protein
MSKHIEGQRKGDGIAIGDITVQDDLKRNPGIGQSKGLAGASDDDVDALAADSTAEGDVANEVNARTGGIGPKHMGRTNN